MKIALVTGSCGLIGFEAACLFSAKGYKIIGIDNDMRSYFFGREASTLGKVGLLKEIINGYAHYNIDIRNQDALESIFKQYSADISVVIHTAAQPSHDWAAKEPLTDFTINANGTLNLLEWTRAHCPKASFIFTSTNKVYGDTPNLLPLVEKELRFEIMENHPCYEGIDESMTIDQSKHSLFGASKVAADILVQEYGRYFDMNTVCFRGGCLTGPNHAGAQLHGFLSYLMKCCIAGAKYSVFGYKGKQVRDNIHSKDLVDAFYRFHSNPRKGEVYNMGGGRDNSCSVLEAINLCEKISGKKMDYEINEQNRIGDHIWYISSLKKFKSHFPGWEIKIGLEEALSDIYTYLRDNFKD